MLALRTYKLICLFIIIICRFLSSFLDYGEVLHPAGNILTVTYCVWLGFLSV
jgi:hypothetical protein